MKRIPYALVTTTALALLPLRADPPPTIRVGSGETALEAAQAKASGSLRLGAGGALESWTHAEDSASWQVDAAAAGAREVDISYACPPGSEGSTVEVACGRSRVTFQVHGTGSADTVVSVPVGLIELPRGPAEVTVRVIAKAPGKGGMSLRRLNLHGGYVPLFSGKSLEGWHGGGIRGYAAEDGILVCRKDGGGNIYTDREYADFAFRFEFRLSRGSNNGLGIRTPDDREKPGVDAAYDGMEIQILDDPGYEGQIQPWQRHGSIYHLAEAKPGHLRPTGEWNVEEVICNGRKVTVKLNGVTIVDANLDELKDPEKKHPGLLRKKGYIGFCGHGTRVDFRNIRIRELRT